MKVNIKNQESTSKPYVALICMILIELFLIGYLVQEYFTGNSDLEFLMLMGFSGFIFSIFTLPFIFKSSKAFAGDYHLSLENNILHSFYGDRIKYNSHNIDLNRRNGELIIEDFFEDQDAGDLDDFVQKKQLVYYEDNKTTVLYRGSLQDFKLFDEIIEKVNKARSRNEQKKYKNKTKNYIETNGSVIYQSPTSLMLNITLIVASIAAIGSAFATIFLSKDLDSKIILSIMSVGFTIFALIKIKTKKFIEVNKKKNILKIYRTIFNKEFSKREYKLNLCKNFEKFICMVAYTVKTKNGRSEVRRELCLSAFKYNGEHIYLNKQISMNNLHEFMNSPFMEILKDIAKDNEKNAAPMNENREKQQLENNQPKQAVFEQLEDREIIDLKKILFRNKNNQDEIKRIPEDNGFSKLNAREVF